jgi:membrane protease subunit (stomatin/prohibitin family)
MAQPGEKFFHIYRVPAEGGPPQRLTDGPFHDIDPVELPDGRVAFASTRIGTFEEYHNPPSRALFVMNLDGSDIHPITHTLIFDNEPKVTADGRIAFIRTDNFFDRGKVETQIHAIRPDGSDGFTEVGAEVGADYGVRLRAFGKYSIKVADPKVFMAEIVGTQGCVGTAQVDSYLKDLIVQRLNDILGEQLKTILDLPRHYDEIAVAVKARLADVFAKYGLELRDFVLGAITPPEEIQKMMDERAQMAIVGDMQQYTAFKAAQAIPEFAKKGGSGGIGMDVGMGLGVGQAMAGVIARGLQPGQPAAAAATVACPKCSKPNVAGTKFCGECGAPMAPPMVACPKCSKPIAGGTRFCGECGANLSATVSCPKCGKTVPTAKFCGECGANF